MKTRRKVIGLFAISSLAAITACSSQESDSGRVKNAALDRSPVLQMAHIVPKNSRQRVSNKMRGPVTLISNSPRLGSALRTEVHCSSWFSYRWARKVWLELGTDYR